MVLRFSLVALALSVIGCGFEASNVLHLDAAFTGEEELAILSAARQWEAATGSPSAELYVIRDAHTRTLDLDEWYAAPDEDHTLVYRTTSHDDAYVQTGEVFGGSYVPGKIWFVTDLHAVRTVDGGLAFAPGKLEHTALHELGHHFGLDHVPNTIMDGVNRRDELVCLSSEVVEAFCALHGDCVDPRTTCTGSESRE
jgi:hypothetical protein